METSLKLVPDEPSFPAPGVLLEICRAAMEAERTHNGWWFIAAAEMPALAELICHGVQAHRQAGERQSVEAMVRRGVLGAGCERWVAACRAAGTIAQAQGYEALSLYLGKKLPFLMERRDPVLSRNPHVIGNLRQEVLLKVSTGLTGLQRPRSFMKWVLAICRTAIRNYLTAHQRDALAYSIPLDEETLVAEQAVRAWAADPVIREQLRGVLAHCLNDAFRLQIIEAYYLEEARIGEIAARVGMNGPMVTQAKFRALRTLKKCHALLEFLEELTP